MAKKFRSSPGPYVLEMEILRDRIPDPTLFPYTLPVLQQLSKLPFHPKVTFLIGENGSGKSTILEAIAVASGLNAEGGTRNFNFSTRPSHSSLDECVRLSRSIAIPRESFFLRAESFYNVATEIERIGVVDAYGSISLHEQSHGESFFSLFLHRFREHGLYLMDEPEAALSPSRQLQFLILLHDYVQRGCQLIIATHSPIIMAYPEAIIYLLDAEGIRQVAYTETEHYLITRRFLGNPQRALEELFSPDESE